MRLSDLLDHLGIDSHSGRRRSAGALSAMAFCHQPYQDRTSALIPIVPGTPFAIWAAQPAPDLDANGNLDRRERGRF